MKNDQIIKMMIIPIGKAAMILTDCKPYMEFSAKIKPIGKRINITAQRVRMALCGSSSGEIRL